MKGLFKIAMFAIPMCFCIDSGAMNFDKPDPNLNEPPLQFGMYNYRIRNGEVWQWFSNGFAASASISDYYNLKAALNWTPRERQQHKSEFVSELFAEGRKNKRLSKLINLAKASQREHYNFPSSLGKEYFDELSTEVHNCLCFYYNAKYLFPNTFAIEYPDSLIKQLNNIKQGSGIILTSDIIQELKEMGDIRDSMQQ